ncbi:MAG: caspase family protein [Candidatus Acidiferrales bacterium]
MALRDGLITFNGLADYVTRAMNADPRTPQKPYWNQNASGDFYLAGHLNRKEALVIGIDDYSGHPLRSAIGGAKQVFDQLDANGFHASFASNTTAVQLKRRLSEFARNLGPQDVALFYFAGSWGIATGKPNGSRRAITTGSRGRQMEHLSAVFTWP